MAQTDRDTITPDDIGERFVPVPNPSVEQVIIGDELVLLDGWTTAVTVSPTGALVWSYFDGEATVEEISRELSRATAAPLEVVAHDVVLFTRQLGADGFLAGVRPPAVDDGLVQLTPIPDLEVGDEVPAVRSHDLDGQERSFADLHGREALIVNWSPHCGYCWAIAELLAVLVGPLDRVGVPLVLLSGVDADSNRAVASAAGLRCPVFIREPDVDPFIGYGTPCAYHVDGAGRLLAPMANGAEQVLAMATELAGLDPYTLLEDADSDPAPPGTRYLLTDGACAPVSGDEPQVHWSGTRAYRVGDHHVGVRHDTEATAEVLDALFAGRRVRDRRAGHSYAVALQLPEQIGASVGVEQDREDTDAPRPGAQDFRLLVAGGVPLVRSRYPSRVLRALLWHLADDTLGYATEPGHLRVQATAALVDGQAVLLPSQINVFGPSMQARLARAGFHVADPPFPEIDLATAELVIPVPAIDHDPTVLHGLDPPVRTGSELPPVGPGRYPLLGWGVIHPADRAVVPFSPAEAAAATLSLVYETDDAPRRLCELGELFTRIRGFGLWYRSEAGLVGAVTQAVRGGSPDDHTAVW